jgi:aminocarboxymuconate-semialdehyde decarboxylase
MADERFKIDLHTHILPREWPDLCARYGGDGWVRLEHTGGGCARMMIGDRCFREVQDTAWDPARRLADCDAHGVRVQVLSTVPVMFSYWAKPAHALDLSKLLNDHIAGVCRAHPERFAGLGTIPMQDARMAVGELQRCVTELGLAGVQIGSNVQGRNLDDPEVFGVFEAAAAIGAAVFVHPWEMLGRDRMSRYWLPWLVGMPAETALAICSLIFGGVLDRLPDLRVGFAHGGGAFAFILGRLEHAFRKRPDLVRVNDIDNPRTYLDRIYLDSAVHDPEALRFLIRTVGAERIALGSDYPFALGEERPGALIESMDDLPAATKQRLLCSTALDFLGLDAGAFAPQAPAKV